MRNFIKNLTTAICAAIISTHTQNLDAVFQSIQDSREPAQISTLITHKTRTPQHRVNANKLISTRANYCKKISQLAPTVPEIQMESPKTLNSYSRHMLSLGRN